MWIKMTQREKIAFSALLFGACLALFYGWRVFWFLTDDAFISFRYVSNSILGYGYVWNPPPFKQVEGYTSFLWVVLLDVIWRISGIQPPDSANIVLLLCTYATVLICVVIVLRMDLVEDLRRHRVLFIALMLAGIITNRTFLAWASSGLETAMFNCFFTLWIFCFLFLSINSRIWIMSTTSTAALIYLTRPDGLLIAAVTVLFLLLFWYGKLRQSTLKAGDIAPSLPLLLIPLHLVWRHSFYGEWLPNTYYAKTISGRIWIESGGKYLFSFIIEYALWIWLMLLIAVVALKLAHSHARLSRLLLLDISFDQWSRAPAMKHSAIVHEHAPGMRLGWLIGALALLGALGLLMGQMAWGTAWLGLAILETVLLGFLGLSLIEAAVVSTVVVHAAYYTFVIGGDHFEFRVYSHLIPLLFISFIWMLNAIRVHARTVTLLLVAFIGLSWPIPWTHWLITRDLTTRQETYVLKASVAKAVHTWLPATPKVIISYLQTYDDMQFWLIDHAVCIRHQEHKIFVIDRSKILISRQAGLQLPSDGYPVIADGTIGLIGWSLPRVNVIDMLGLNDYVIARNPDLLSIPLMAHERRPPAGYVECFEPNVGWGGEIHQRAVALTADKIRGCELSYVARVAQK
jgi:arabinofuranosyltransferase